ncbi:MAG: DUF547 domain-containing protein [Pedosphaera sp.]|nr:DUF547 domain-containing protein [Pedosphaera sp.]
MNPGEAKFLLSAQRPNGADAEDPQFAEATQRVREDPDLRPWVQGERAWDSAIAGCLRSVPVPLGLQARILAGRRAVVAPRWWQKLQTIALAAMGILLLALWVYWIRTPQPGSVSHFQASMAKYLKSWILCNQALLLAILSMTHAVIVHATSFDSNYTNLASVLRNHVRNGEVSYAALKAAPSTLTASLGDLASVGESEFNGWDRQMQLSFLINLYNASTLKLVADHYPIPSIKKIGTLWKGPWKQPVVRIWGGLKTLDSVEHELIRARFAEPRIHFALVCAAKGCPPLRSEPYIGARLDQQLEDQGRVFLAQSAKNRADADSKTLYLSPIFNWFGSDFTTAGKTLLDYVKQYLPPSAVGEMATGTWRIRHTPYDWSLNDRSP